LGEGAAAPGPDIRGQRNECFKHKDDCLCSTIFKLLRQQKIKKKSSVYDCTDEDVENA